MGRARGRVSPTTLGQLVADEASRPEQPDVPRVRVLEPDEDPDDPDLRLRIVRTATGSLHESIREDERRRVGKTKRKGSIFRSRSRAHSLFSTASLRRPGTGKSDKSLLSADHGITQLPRTSTSLGEEEQRANALKFTTPEHTKGKRSKPADDRDAEARRRRNVYVNMSLPPDEVDASGEPLARWARNKVRTSKFTLLSFVPKNLTEQFRRVANIYFLALVVLQVFPIFGAAAPQIAMLPLVAVLGITAIKDGIEDYRRHVLDNAVNNAPVTRLGRWRNVNINASGSSWIMRMLGRARPLPTQTSRGVRRLREKEGNFSTDFLYSSGKPSTTTLGEGDVVETLDYDLETASHGGDGASTIGHDTVASLPPSRGRALTTASSAAPSFRSLGGSSGVVSYQRSVPGTAVWERTLSKKLEVGDVVLLKDGEQVPADLVVLATSDADGCCFVETKSLDGETNLKPRRALKATLSIQSEEDVEHSRFVVDAEPPHANLYSFNGVLRYPLRDHSPVLASTATIGGPEVEAKVAMSDEAITINELLLRGCALRNTTWVIGMVVYTGADTKIQLNQGDTPSKRSKIEKESNYNVLANFLILVVICLICAVADGLLISRTGTSAGSYEPGVELSGNAVVDAVVTFAACLILFQTIVPISLVITVELVKTIQAWFIYLDIDMYYDAIDQPAIPRSWNLSDDLGQIEYVFSDKTGTLTQNVMELQRCSVGGVAYGEGMTEAQIGAAKRRQALDGSALEPSQNPAQLLDVKRSMISRMRSLFRHRYLQETKLTLISTKLADDLSVRAGSQRQRVVDFFRAVALCHTSLVERPEPDEPDLIDYKAESPDESALVAAARDAGFVFLARTNQALEIEVLGQPERWQPLRVLEFNSTRKRMSVLVRAPSGQIHLITKGADSVIYARLAADHASDLKESTMRDLETFANGGLRTLVIASRIVDEAEFASWCTKYDAACAATTDREDEIERACELIEHDLHILGATALEDKLQVGVPETIEQLHAAGIRIWVLTGDKLQTAIEIGFSCSLLTSEMDVMIISSDTEHGAETQIRAGMDKIARAREAETAAGAHVVRQEHAVVIDGETLRHALSDHLKPAFLELTVQCETVVCCRVSPAQKAQTVRLVKEGKQAMTLAIGDGANDVSMIQEAHIGIGIAGLEGAQASMSADYAIGQFRYLSRLLLVHGRWSTMRIGALHANFFYKSAIWTLTMFWYQLFSSFNGTYIYDYSFLMLYALVFTSLPVLVMGALDKDLSAAASLAYPQLYRHGLQGLYYTKTMFWAYMVDGIYQSLVCYFIPHVLLRNGITMSSTGRDPTLQDFGTTIAVGTVLAANLFVGLNTYSWTWLVFASVIVSSLLVWLWIAIYGAFPGLSFTGTAAAIFGTADFWLVVAVVQIFALGPRFVWKYVQVTYRPIDSDIVRERVLLGLDGAALAGSSDLEKRHPPSDDARSTAGPPGSTAGASSSVYGAKPAELEMSSMVALQSSTVVDQARTPSSMPSTPQRFLARKTSTRPPASPLHSRGMSNDAPSEQSDDASDTAIMSATRPASVATTNEHGAVYTTPESTAVHRFDAPGSARSFATARMDPLEDDDDDGDADRTAVASTTTAAQQHGRVDSSFDVDRYYVP